MGYSVEIKGQERLRRRLVDVMPRKMREAVGTAMLSGADDVVGLARALAPRLSGELAASIHHTEVRESKRGGLYVAIVAGDRSTEEHSASGTYQKARLVEFGHMNAPAEPFFFVSFRARKPAIRRSMTQAVKRAVAEN